MKNVNNQYKQLLALNLACLEEWNRLPLETRQQTEYDEFHAKHLAEHGVVIQVSAHWIEGKRGFHCSNCRGGAALHPTKRGALLSDHCPHCGAIMLPAKTSSSS